MSRGRWRRCRAAVAAVDQERAQPRVGVAAQHQLRPRCRRSTRSSVVAHGQVLGPGVRAQRRPPTLGVEVVEDLDVEQPDALRRPLRSITAARRAPTPTGGRCRPATGRHRGRRPCREVLDHVTVVAVVDRVGSAQLDTIPAQRADRHLVAPHRRQVDDDVERVERPGSGSRRVAPGHRLGDRRRPSAAPCSPSARAACGTGRRTGRRRGSSTSPARWPRSAPTSSRTAGPSPDPAPSSPCTMPSSRSTWLPRLFQSPPSARNSVPGGAEAPLRRDRGPHRAGQLGVDAQPQRRDAGERRRGPHDLGQGEVVGAVAQPGRRTTRTGRCAATPSRLPTTRSRPAGRARGRSSRTCARRFDRRANRASRSRPSGRK